MNSARQNVVWKTSKKIEKTKIIIITTIIIIIIIIIIMQNQKIFFLILSIKFVSPDNYRRKQSVIKTI